MLIIGLMHRGLVKFMEWQFIKGSTVIRVEPYKKEWPILFQQEKDRILEKIQQWVVAVEHVGSTSIPGLPAKPTIDMCLIVKSFELADKHIIEKLTSVGYQYLPKLENTIPDRRYVQLLDKGEHKFHIHIVEEDSERQEHYILIRDYLRENPQDANEYAKLKQKLSEQYTHDRAAYTDGKAEFITALYKKAKAWQDKQNASPSFGCK